MGNKPAKTNKKVFIIGGSFAGFTLACQIWELCDLTIIDQKEFFEYTLTLPRCFIKDNDPNELLIPLQECRKYTGNKFNYIQGTLLNVLKEDKVIIKNKNFDLEILNFDVLVICTGSNYSSPIKAKDDKLVIN